MTTTIPPLDGLAEIDADWTFLSKEIHPGVDLSLPEVYLKWYDIRAADQEPTPEVSDAAREYIRGESAVGGLEFHKELGYVLLHREGEKYFMIIAVWRGRDELWTGIFSQNDEGAFQPYPVKPGLLRATQSVAELDATAHERRAWSRYLHSDRSEAAKRAYVEDYCTGIVGIP